MTVRESDAIFGPSHAFATMAPEPKGPAPPHLQLPPGGVPSPRKAKEQQRLAASHKQGSTVHKPSTKKKPKEIISPLASGTAADFKPRKFRAPPVAAATITSTATTTLSPIAPSPRKTAPKGKPPLPAYVDIGDDFAGLEEFGSEPKQKTHLRKLATSEGGATPLEQLRSILSVGFARVLDLFRDWDDDESQTISKSEFRRALPVLGLLVDKEVADSLFDTFDADGSGEIDYRELSKQLRQGSDVELDDALKDGAVEIQTETTQGFALRTGLEEGASKGFGGALKLDLDGDVPIVEQLQKALGAPGVLMRAIDIFRAWDDDDSGTISKKEFRQALPAIGLKVSKEQSDELFASFDDDNSGSIDYSEIQKKLRKRLANGPTSKSPRLPKLKQAASSHGGGHTYSNVRDAKQQELEVQRMLSNMKRRLMQAEHEANKAAHLARKQAEGAAIRTDMDRRVGRDMTERVKNVTPASQEECAVIAALFHNCLEGKSWFWLFRTIDEDGSGRISFLELKRGCRNILNLSQQKLPDVKLQSVWRTLDEDASGFISTGEFGAFMRMSPPVKREKPPPVEKPKKEFEIDDHAQFSRQLVDQGVEPAGDDEMLELSRALAIELNRLPPNQRGWYNLFRKVDEDQSGQISFQELETIVRNGLRIDHTAVPRRKLLRVWVRMDEDLSGQIDAGEFGHFMRLATRTTTTHEGPKGIVVQTRDWRSPGKRQSELGFVSPKAEEEMAMALEVERATAAMERMRQEAANVEQLIRQKELELTEYKLPAAAGGDERVASSFVNPSAATADAGNRRRTVVRVKVAGSKPVPIEVVQAYGGQARRSRTGGVALADEAA